MSTLNSFSTRTTIRAGGQDVTIVSAAMRYDHSAQSRARLTAFFQPA